MKMKKKCFALLLAMLLLLGFSACTAVPKENNDEADRITINVICESSDIYQIYYSCYFGGSYYSMGGMADLDHKELTKASELSLVLTKPYLGDRDDISDFGMTFSPYGKEDTREIGTTNLLSIPARYGQTYTVVFSGSADTGFVATLR